MDSDSEKARKVRKRKDTVESKQRIKVEKEKEGGSGGRV